jgi:hypothetical protein
MNPLAARKKILIAESELNRAQIVANGAELQAGLRALAARAKSFSSLASAAVVLVAGVAALRRGPRNRATTAPATWRQTLVKGAGFASSIWLAFRAKRGIPPDK